MDSTTFGVIGAAYGAVLGAGLFRVRRSTPADALLAALWATVATAIAAIVAQHDSRFRSVDPFLERVDVVAALIAGPLLLLYCRAALLQRRPRRIDLLHAIPAAVSLFVALPMEIVILCQVAYTAAAATLTVRHAPAEADAFHRTAARLLLASFAFIHAAQLVRLFWSQVGPLRNVVAVVASAVVLLFGLALALRGGQGVEQAFWPALRSPTPRQAGRPAPHRILPRYRHSALAGDDAQRTVERLDELMRGESLFRDPGLSLSALAARLSVTTHHLSQSINQHRGTTLTDYLAVWRVEEAKRQLLDPARDNVTIDAIAESSGFGSRSAFYNAFRRLAGGSPTELRRRSRSGS
jgi:AraC-like DNA-binding protein